MSDQIGKQQVLHRKTIPLSLQSHQTGGGHLKDYHTTDERIVHYIDPMYDFLTSQIALLAICGVLIMCDASQI